MVKAFPAALVLALLAFNTPAAAQKGMPLDDGEMGARLGCAINSLGPRNPGCEDYPYGVPAPLDPGEGVYAAPGELPPGSDPLPTLPHMAPGEGVTLYPEMPDEAELLQLPPPATYEVPEGEEYQLPDLTDSCRPAGTNSDRGMPAGCPSYDFDAADVREEPAEPEFHFSEGRRPGEPCPHTGSTKTCDEIQNEGGGGIGGYASSGGVAQ